MTANYNGLTRNAWPGTWSPSADHPIVLDKEIRGGLRTLSGSIGDRLTDITGQRLEVGMMVYLQEGYTEGGTEFLGDRYYIYRSLEGESRNIDTGELPNSVENWQIFDSGTVDLASIDSNLVPETDITFDLGSLDKRWKDIYAETLYLGTNTIFLGSDRISLDGEGNLLINGNSAIEKVRFFVAGDDSNLRTINADDAIKFIGSNGISTATDDDGNITITGPTIDLSPYATTSFVVQEISNLVGSAPETLNTLNELSAALNNDENFGAAILTEISNKLDKTDQFTFKVAGDDSAVKEITSRETIKFVGGIGITTASDLEGNIIIDGFSGDYRDLSNIPEEFSFDVVTDDSSSFTVRNGSALRLSGNFGIKVEGDSTEGFVISGPDLSALEQSLIPAITEVYDLGSPDKRWKDLYLSGNTIEIGTVTIGVQPVEGEQDRLAVTGANSLSIGGAVIRASQNTFDLPVGSTVNGERLITRVELLENSFEMNVVGDDSSSRPIRSGDDLKISGAGGTTTRISAEGDVVVSSIDKFNELSDVDIDPDSLSIGKVLKYNGQSWVAADEAGGAGAGSGSGDAATLNGFNGTHYLNYNNLTNKPDPYELPPATADTLGGVKIGENININNGTISVPTGAGINKVVDIPDVVDDELGDGAFLTYNEGAVRWETRALDLSNSVMDGGFY